MISDQIMLLPLASILALPIVTNYARKKLVNRELERSRDSLEFIISRSGSEALEKDILNETNELLATEIGNQPVVQLTDTTNVVNRGGYVIKTNTVLESGKKVNILVKYCDELTPMEIPKWSRLISNLSGSSEYAYGRITREDVMTGGAIQRYLHNIIGLGYVANAAVISERIGNISYFIEDSQSLTEVEKNLNDTMRIEVAKDLIKKALEIAVAPVKDGYFVNKLLFRKNLFPSISETLLRKDIKKRYRTVHETKIKQIDFMLKEDTDVNFREVYKSVIGKFLDERAAFLSHNDLYSQNILVNNDKKTIIDFDNSKLQSFYYDINSIIKTLGLREHPKLEIKKSLQNYARETLKDMLKSVDIPSVKTVVPINDSETKTIGIGNPSQKNEFEMTATYVEFDNDLMHALVLEKILSLNSTKKGEEDLQTIEKIKNYYYSRAKLTIESFDPASDLAISYKNFLKSKSLPILDNKEITAIEEKYHPDQNTSKYTKKYKRKIKPFEIKERIENHARKAIEGESLAAQKLPDLAWVFGTSSLVGYLAGISSNNLSLIPYLIPSYLIAILATGLAIKVNSKGNYLINNFDGAYSRLNRMTSKALD